MEMRIKWNSNFLIKVLSFKNNLKGEEIFRVSSCDWIGICDISFDPFLGNLIKVS
jgi:hypothetical protein